MRTFLAAVLAALTVAACSIVPSPSAPGPVPYPDGCPMLGFSELRCRSVVERAAADQGIDPATVVAIALLPPPTPVNGVVILENHSGYPPVRVALVLADGRTVRTMVNCSGVGRNSDPACVDDPVPTLHTPHDGYWDVPCAGEPPEGCASPPPSPEPDVLAAARPLRLASVTAPVDRVGHHEVELGRAVLPNGILGEATAQLGSIPEGSLFGEEGIRLEIHPADPARPPFDNLYLRPPADGPEAVVIVLVFEVLEPGAGGALEIRNLVVE